MMNILGRSFPKLVMGSLVGAHLVQAGKNIMNLKSDI